MADYVPYTYSSHPCFDMTNAVPAWKSKYLKIGARASEARRLIVESANPAYRLLPYYYIFDKSKKRPYWFHDLHQAFLCDRLVLSI